VGLRRKGGGEGKKKEGKGFPLIPSFSSVLYRKEEKKGKPGGVDSEFVERGSTPGAPEEKEKEEKKKKRKKGAYLTFQKLAASPGAERGGGKKKRGEMFVGQGGKKKESPFFSDA